MEPSSQLTKVRICIDCSAELLVHRNSGKKRCESCNKIQARKAVRQYNAKDPERAWKRVRDGYKKRTTADPRLKLLYSSRSRAALLGLQHSILVDDIVIPNRCPVLDVPFVEGTYHTPSLDRINSTKGYIPGNVQVMTHQANAMKNNATPEELRQFALWISETYGLDDE